MTGEMHERKLQVRRLCLSKCIALAAEGKAKHVRYPAVDPSYHDDMGNSSGW